MLAVGMELPALFYTLLPCFLSAHIWNGHTPDSTAVVQALTRQCYDTRSHKV